jgi:hypothetical protein
MATLAKTKKASPKKPVKKILSVESCWQHESTLRVSTSRYYIGRVSKSLWEKTLKLTAPEHDPKRPYNAVKIQGSLRLAKPTVGKRGEVRVIIRKEGPFGCYKVFKSLRGKPVGEPIFSACSTLEHVGLKLPRRGEEVLGVIKFDVVKPAKKGVKKRGVR